MRSVALLLVVGCSYSPGSFSYPGRYFAGQRLTVGCLDVSIDRRPDLFESAILDYQFGNRCDDPVVVDLLKVPVIGRTVDGNEVTLTPYDPRMEITAMKLDARQAGGEAISYPTTVKLVQVCVDAAGLGGGAKLPHWVCFGSKRPLEDAPEPDETAPPDQDDEPELEHEEVRA